MTPMTHPMHSIRPPAAPAPPTHTYTYIDVQRGRLFIDVQCGCHEHTECIPLRLTASSCSASDELRSRATALREKCLAFPDIFLVPLFFNMSALCLLYMRLEQRCD